MKIALKGELYWDGERYVVDQSSLTTVEYEGPVAQAGGGGKTQTNTVTQDIPPYLQAGHQQLIGQANEIGLDPNAQMTPQSNVLQHRAVGQMEDVANRIPGIVDQNWKPAQQAIGYLLDPNNLRAESNPYIQSYADAATRGITSNFTQNVLPNIRGDALSSGQFGGSRQGLNESGAAGAYMTSLGDTYAKIANDSYTRQLGGLIAGTQMAPTYANQALSMADAQSQYLANAGNYQQQIAANDLQAPYQRLSWLSSFYPGNVGGSSTSIGAAPYTNPWLGAAGGAASGASAGAAIGGQTGGWWGAGIGALAGYLMTK